jgi:hypothetical protein
MATAIITSLLSFMLVSVLGAYLAQKWQRAAWAKQQTYLGREKEYEALKALSDEIAMLSARRLYASRHVSASIRSDDDARFEASVSKYADVVREWNDKLQSFYVKLTFYASYCPYVYRLESLHAKFRSVGLQLEAGIRRRRAANEKHLPLQLSKELNTIEANLFSFSRDLLGLMEERRKQIYYGVKIPYDAFNFRQLTTLELLLLLLKPRVDLNGVFRTSFDLPPPGFRGLLGAGIDEHSG